MALATECSRWEEVRWQGEVLLLAVCFAGSQVEEVASLSG